MNPYFLLAPQHQIQLDHFESLSREEKLYLCGLNPKQGLVRGSEVLVHSIRHKLEAEYYHQPL